MSEQNIIGDAVRRLRVGQGLTQDAFAARCQRHGWSLSRQTLSKIEAKLRQVNDAEVYFLSKELGCSIAELFPSSKAKVAKILRHSRD